MMREMFFLIGLPVLALAVIYTLLFSLGYWSGARACRLQSVSFEDHEYGMFQGCMVKHNGRWLPLDNIRGFDDKG